MAASRALTGLDAYVRAAQAKEHVPGVALAVVHSGSVVTASFGRRSARRARPVDRDTLFQLASCGKAFTAAACAILVEEGRIRWDEPVAEHLAGLRLSDPYVTDHVTVRDLLTHRTGLPGADLLWASGQFDRAETLRRLRHLRPSSGFRERFQYQNLMYVVAGELVGAVSGLGYDEFVVRRIFRPLGMGASLTNTATLARRRNVAEPHAVVRGRAIRIPRWEDPVGSGDGSILSSARDLVPWLRFQLGEGSIGSRRLVGRATFREMHEPQIPIRAGRWELGLLRALGSRPVLAYGLGWFLMDYRGRRISRHTGGIDGMSCVVTLVPDKGLGVAVLTNAEDPILPDALAFWTIDRCLGLPDRDWCAILGALARRDRARADARRRRLASTWLRRARPSVPLREYAGRYADDYYGVVTVRRRGRGLVLRFGTTFNGPLIHRHHDTFEFRPTRHPGMPFVPVSFGVGSRGLVDSLRLEVGPRETPRFRRVP